MNKTEITKNEFIKNFIEKNKISDETVNENIDVFSDFIYETSLNRSDITPVLSFENNQIIIAYKLNKSENNQIYSIGIEIKSLQDKTLKDFDLNGERTDAFKKILNFDELFLTDENNFHPGVFLSGNFGIGKTYLATLLAIDISKNGKKVAIVNMTALVDKIRESNSITEQRRVINQLSNSDLLIFDDFGAGHLTDFIRDEIIGSILEKRMIDKKPVVFTSNFTIDGLVEGYLSLTKNTVDLVKSNRILERIKFLSREVKMGGGNRRN